MAGRPERVPDEDILEVFRETDDPVLSASEVSNVIDLRYNGTLKRLDNLAERGLLNTKRVGQGRAFWLNDRGRAYLAGEIDVNNQREI